MNIDINQELIKSITKYLVIIAIPFLIVKFGYLALLPYLEKTSNSLSSIEQNNFYNRFKFSKSFDIKYYKPPKVQTPKVTGKVYKLTDIKLKGIYLSKDKNFITIEDKKKIEFVDLNSEYKGYLLILIERDKAIFTRSGKNYELTLNSKKLPEYKEIKSNAESSFSVDKNIVRNFSRNFDEIWKHISIKEVRKNGEIEGFKIRYIDYKSIFGKMGLKAGDLIISVNNKRLKSYADAFEIYKKIDKLDGIKITIIRDNEQKDLEYEIN